MRKILFFGGFLTSLIVHGQTKILNQPVLERNLSQVQRVDEGLASTYQGIQYYIHEDFDLKSDLEFQLPFSEKKVKAQYEKTLTYSNGSYSAVYKIVGEPYAEFVLSKYDNVVTGIYVSREGSKYIFHQTHPTILSVAAVNEKALIRQDDKDDFIMVETTSTNNTARRVHANVCLETTPDCINNTINHLIVYTAAVKNAWGGTAQVNSFMATAVTNANQSLIASGVTSTVVTHNIVHTVEEDYTESNNTFTDLQRIRGNGDGFMDDVHTLRDTYGADVVSLILASPTNTCGLGYVNAEPTNYRDDIAFNLSIYTCVVPNYSWAHEVGHNMGLNHDWYTSNNSNPCGHHHGYVNQEAIQTGTSATALQRWRTIMAYNNHCSANGFYCARINRWANPDVNYNNAPTGIAIHLPEPSHEALGFRKMSCIVAGFRPTAMLATKEVAVSISEFAVYPNPAQDFVQIKTPEHGKYSFIMVNSLGQIVQNAVETRIPVGHLEKGVYYLSIVKDDTEIIGTKKLIIE